jgi:AcrR family transcriptional regulator
MPTAVVRVEVRDAILDAAERLLGRFGYRKTTMDDLATEAGIGKGTTYLHFPSKEGVFLATVDRIVARLHARLQVIAEGDVAAPARLRAMLRERVLFRFDAVQSYAQSLDELLGAFRASFLERREQHFREEAEIFAAVLADGRRRGELTFKSADRSARAMLLATNSLLPYNLSPRELGERAALSEQVAAIAELLLQGLVQRA